MVEEVDVHGALACADKLRDTAPAKLRCMELSVSISKLLLLIVDKSQLTSFLNTTDHVDDRQLLCNKLCALPDPLRSHPAAWRPSSRACKFPSLTSTLPRSLPLLAFTTANSCLSSSSRFYKNTKMGKFKFKVPCRGLKRPISPTKHAAVTDPDPSRQGFTRGNTKSNQNLKAQYNNGQAQSPISQQAPPLPHMTNSPSISSTFSEQSGYVEPEKKFLNEKYAKCSVKGNFLTLAAQPKNVELGEWLAHQCESRAPC